jgi:hypothetical protein
LTDNALFRHYFSVIFLAQIPGFAKKAPLSHGQWRISRVNLRAYEEYDAEEQSMKRFPHKLHIRLGKQR